MSFKLGGGIRCRRAISCAVAARLSFSVEMARPDGKTYYQMGIPVFPLQSTRKLIFKGVACLWSRNLTTCLRRGTAKKTLCARSHEPSRFRGAFVGDSPKEAYSKAPADQMPVPEFQRMDPVNLPVQLLQSWNNPYQATSERKRACCDGGSLKDHILLRCEGSVGWRQKWYT